MYDVGGHSIRYSAGSVWTSWGVGGEQVSGRARECSIGYNISVNTLTPEGSGARGHWVQAI